MKSAVLICLTLCTTAVLAQPSGPEARQPTDPRSVESLANPRARNRPWRCTTIPTKDGFAKRENRIDSTRRTVDWFDKYPKAEPTGPRRTGTTSSGK